MPKRVLLAVLFLGVAVSILRAHDLFIKLDSYFLQPQTTVQVPLLNGTFSASENAVAPNRVGDVSLVSPAGRARIGTARWGAQGDTSVVTLRIGEAGTYVLGVSTRPRELDLSAEDFNEYLEHDGIPDVLEARRRDGELDRPVRERYAKHVKAIFQVGSARSDSYAATLDYPAEIVPLDNPYALRPGDRFPFRCLVDGEPVGGQLVIVGGETRDGRARVERSARTDESGVAMFRLAEPGKWYVKFIHMVPVEEARLDYESTWATLTFELR